MTFRPLPPTEDDDDAPLQTMEPLRRKFISSRRAPVVRQRQPISVILQQAAEEEKPEDDASEAALPADFIPTRAGQREVDPLFAYLFLISLGIGLSTFDPTVRFMVLWTLMGTLGVMGYLLGTVERMREARIDDLVWGLAFGFLASFPFLLVFGASLETISIRMFDVEATPTRIMHTWVFMAVAFVIPASETLFFRGAVQGVRGILITTILATLWSAVVFFPFMSLEGRTVIVIILIIVFTLLNFMYSYVRFRNGLAGAWLCQMVSYTLLWFLPRLLF